MEALPQDPKQAGQQGQPAVVIRDAGSANHIIGWLRGWDGVSVYAEGPAARIAAREGLSIAPTLEGTLRRSDWLLVGTGGDPLSQEAMRLGKARGLPVLAVVDHWTNYRDRFSEIGEGDKPDAVIVTDRHAQELAREELPWAEILVWPNHMLEQLRKTLEQCQGSTSERQRLLLLSEPIKDRQSDPLNPRTRSPLSRIDDLLLVLGLAPNLTDITLRLHPSETLADHRQWIISLGGRAKIESPLGTSIIEALAHANAVLGVTTYALYLAWAAGQRVYSLAESATFADPFPPGSVPQLLLSPTTSKSKFV